MTKHLVARSKIEALHIIGRRAADELELDYEAAWRDMVELGRLGMRRDIRVTTRGSEYVLVGSPSALFAGLSQAKSSYRRRFLCCGWLVRYRVQLTSQKHLVHRLSEGLSVVRQILQHRPLSSATFGLLTGSHETHVFQFLDQQLLTQTSLLHCVQRRRGARVVQPHRSHFSFIARAERCWPSASRPQWQHRQRHQSHQALRSPPAESMS